MAAKYTLEDFIKQARLVHGDRYDYSSSVYVNTLEKVEIVCRLHGGFMQTPPSHLRGRGCPECGKLQIVLKKRTPVDEFLNRAREVHGDRFDYSRVNYTGDKNKIEIICPVHGAFLQNPRDHLISNGCPKCARAKVSTEDFIQKARQIHGDRYDYSRVVYTNSRAKVEIICPDHGVFEQQAGTHLENHGCPHCARAIVTAAAAAARMHDTASFIEAARKRHGDRYDYSRVAYVEGRKKVEIICPEHGLFVQAAGKHLAGDGCPACGHEARRSASVLGTAAFIQKAQLVHGDKYDYSRVEYKDNGRIHVEIICPTHGSFWQSPNNHLTGFGCAECGRAVCGEANSLNTETFIQSARKVHGDKYDYSCVEYSRTHNCVEIICPEHGAFSQKPTTHLGGRGCPECGIARWKAHVESRRKTTENAIADFREVHGDKYDYSRVDYVNALTKVEIVCPEHGVFFQTPNAHLSGHGCLECAQRLTGNQLHINAPETPSFLYVFDMALGTEYFFKVGIALDVEERIYRLQYEAPYEVGIVDLFQGTRLQCWETEQELLAEFRRTHPHNPEYEFAGQFECLHTNPLAVPGVRDRIIKKGLTPYAPPMRSLTANTD